MCGCRPPALRPHWPTQPDLILGRSEEAQRQLLTEVFLETDAQIATDEGCTATVVLMQQQEGGLLVQVRAGGVSEG